ncbi:hypothetical protein GJ654_15805 [Rhodoblastus acidophilus]|uniref:HNH endonuclease 5 domain-containing protein n=1 Tax=Rhodoblastus acidophilus TaxID=1074 RepID=A0A6N8DTG6_RHOAC|nr:hypothetical protein [Rhodoblastus acidophilus]MCW2275904.1 hypothetical protein [Rhodoblastus acidophilus]MTV32451.1 hypothetical protein [Rhodoblastus acidophilus]
MPNSPDMLRKFAILNASNAPAARYYRLQVNPPTNTPKNGELSTDKMLPIQASAPPDIFQHHISTNDTRVILGRINFCIYCGAPTKTAKGDAPPTDEHVIPEGLGGNLILERASCQSCAILINSFEGKLQKTLFHAPRRKLNIRGKRRPKDTLFEVTTRINGTDTTLKLPLESHPTALLLPQMLPARIMTTRAPNVPGFSGISLHSLVPTDPLQYSSLDNFATPGLDLVRFCQLLAKIAHSYASAFIQIKSFNLSKIPEVNHEPSRLVPLILRRYERTEYDISCYDYVGGLSGDFSASGFLHEIGIGNISISRMDFTCVFVRLFANMGAPIYCVVVDYKI